VVTDAEVPGARYRLRTDGLGGWQLDPLGVAVTPHGLAATQLADLGALLADAKAPPVELPAPAPPPPPPAPPARRTVRLISTLKPAANPLRSSVMANTSAAPIDAMRKRRARKRKSCSVMASMALGP